MAKGWLPLCCGCYYRMIHKATGRRPIRTILVNARCSLHPFPSYLTPRNSRVPKHCLAVIRSDPDKMLNRALIHRALKTSDVYQLPPPDPQSTVSTKWPVGAAGSIVWLGLTFALTKDYMVLKTGNGFVGEGYVFSYCSLPQGCLDGEDR